MRKLLRTAPGRVAHEPPRRTLYAVPKKWPGAEPFFAGSVATRMMLKLPGMKNAPPVLSFVTCGSLVVSVTVVFQPTRRVSVQPFQWEAGPALPGEGLAESLFLLFGQRDA